MSQGRVFEFGFDEQHDDHAHAPRTCPECDAAVQAARHETVCTDCGLVVESERMDRGPEWRSFDADERERTGAPLTASRHDRGLSTKIGVRKDGNGNALDASTKRRFSRLRREHRRAQCESKVDQNRRAGFIEIRRLTSALGFDESLRDQACHLFKTAQEANLLLGRSIEAMATASLYAACRIQEQPRLIASFVDVAQVERSSVENAYSVLNRELELPTVPPQPSSYVPLLCSTLDLSDAVRRTALDLCTAARDAGVANGRHPAGVAAACVYLAAPTGVVTQEAVATVADVSIPTVRERCREVQAVR